MTSAPFSSFSLSSGSTVPLSDHELLRALRQRRRALRALRGFAYEGISSDTARDVGTRLRDEVTALQRECSQRGLEPRE